jgi:hypothetical protein
MGVADIQRRIPVIYRLPRTDPQLPQAFREAVLATMAVVRSGRLNAIDHDEDMRLITGSYPDFHPRVGGMCELDRNLVRRQQVEPLIDTRDSLRRIRLGRISSLPRNMTRFFLDTYRRYVRDLQNRIDSLEAELRGPPPPPPGRAAQIQQEIAALQAEIDRIEPKIEQLEQYENRLPSIEDGLRQRADAVIP